jgi:hypothetical protein
MKIPTDILVRPTEGIMARKFKAEEASYKGREPTWMVVGFDISMVSISGAAMMYDGLLDKIRGPAVVNERWDRNVHYFDRLRVASRPENFVHSLMSGLHGAVVDLDQTFIAVEEPWPLGIVRKAESGWLKQQAQIQGTFIGGLVRYGFDNIYEVNSQSWKKVVADELGVKVQPSKEFKWTVKQWAIDTYGLEDLPDLINNTKLGMIPKPATSRAKPVQPEDVYDAMGLCAWMEKTYLEGREGGS